VLDIMDKANKVIDDYKAQGLTLTVRQLYYRFIAFDLFPESWIDKRYNQKNGLDENTKNTLKNYKRLADIVNTGRLEGLIDWNSIEDRTRWLREYARYADPAELIRRNQDTYGEDLWADQDNYVEVWIEKDALSGVIEGPCGEYRVPFFPTRGYNSQSEQYIAGKRLQRIVAQGKKVTIFHLGDHDPSGLDMTRDNDLRVLTFARNSEIEFVRLALNMDQVRQYNCPPNPAKESDSRFAGYHAEFGEQSWELDALEPKVIAELVRTNIASKIDPKRFEAAKEREAESRRMLELLSANWNQEVTTLLGMIDRNNA
jgi:hypothetical protein